MSFDVWIPLGYKTSIFLTVLAIGLGSRAADAVSLLHRPGQLGKSLLAINVIMPLVMITVIRAVDITPAVAVALLALTVSPVPPLLLKKQIKANGEPSYAIGLLVIVAATAVIFSPLAVQLLGRLFVRPVHMPAWSIARVVLIADLVPLAAGILIRKTTPVLASRFSKPVAMAGDILLVVSLAPVAILMWPEVKDLLGNAALIATTAFVLVGLAVGHWLGGPKPQDRAVLALATAKRHPGIAMAIAATNFPEKSVLPSIVLYTAVSAISILLYAAWRKRAQQITIERQT